MAAQILIVIFPAASNLVHWYQDVLAVVLAIDHTYIADFLRRWNFSSVKPRGRIWMADIPKLVQVLGDRLARDHGRRSDRRGNAGLGCAWQVSADLIYTFDFTNGK